MMLLFANKWVLWLALTMLLYIVLFILVPSRIIKQYLLFAVVTGFLQAVIIVWLFQIYIGYWQLVGDPVILGVTTLFTPAAWISPTIIFAAYFPKGRQWYYIVGYILIFAAGAVATQIFLEQLGMWRSISWTPLMTGGLAVAAHTVITVTLFKTSLREKQN